MNLITTSRHDGTGIQNAGEWISKKIHPLNSLSFSGQGIFSVFFLQMFENTMEILMNRK